MVLDWATLGTGPPGFDLAHLILSATGQLWPHAAADEIDDVLFDAYMHGLDRTELRPVVRLATAATVALVGVSRLCWTLRRTDERSVVDSWSSVAGWLVARGREAHDRLAAPP